MNGAYEQIEVSVGPDGIIRGHSDLLGLDLCWIDGRLRFYNPASGEYLRDPITSEEERQAAEARLASERAARQAAEDIAASERAAREAAEAELARLREQLRSDKRPEASRQRRVFLFSFCAFRWFSRDLTGHKS